jgi:hypothetical protein
LIDNKEGRKNENGKKRKEGVKKGREEGRKCEANEADIMEEAGR